jgi:outer membrane porin, OprD family
MKSSVRSGRQTFESFLTAANDTKMIPNAFEGVSFESSDLRDTLIKAAWFDRQKLRDHTSFHHVLAYGDDPENPYSSWTENDDSAMHKGLGLSKLKAAGIDDRLIVVQAENKSIPDLSIMANFTDVPDLVGLVAGEVNYTIAIAGGITLVPGLRYVSQRDHGGGKIGGASLAGKISIDDARGYRNPHSLDGSLVAARISLTEGAGSILVGYSKVSDDADFVVPWRAFPTSGYTRAMGRYNWNADTETWMLQTAYDFSKGVGVPGLSIQARYAVENYDDEKPDVQADCNVLNIDVLERVGAVPGLEIKLRSAFVDGKSDTLDMNGVVKADPSYNEYRLEMNYLF